MSPSIGAVRSRRRPASTTPSEVCAAVGSAIASINVMQAAMYRVKEKKDRCIDFPNYLKNNRCADAQGSVMEIVEVADCYVIS